MTMISKTHIVIKKESASMGSLYSIYIDAADGHIPICTDLPRREAMRKLEVYMIGV